MSLITLCHSLCDPLGNWNFSCSAVFLGCSAAFFFFPIFKFCTRAGVVLFFRFWPKEREKRRKRERISTSAQTHTHMYAHTRTIGRAFSHPFSGGDLNLWRSAWLPPAFCFVFLLFTHNFPSICVSITWTIFLVAHKHTHTHTQRHWEKARARQHLRPLNAAIEMGFLIALDSTDFVRVHVRRGGTTIEYWICVRSARFATRKRDGICCTNREIARERESERARCFGEKERAYTLLYYMMLANAIFRFSFGPSECGQRTCPNPLTWLSDDDGPDSREPREFRGVQCTRNKCGAIQARIMLPAIDFCSNKS